MAKLRIQFGKHEKDYGEVNRFTKSQIKYWLQHGLLWIK